MADGQNILCTGGSGLLGTALRKRWPGAWFPASADFDITRPEAMEAWATGKDIRCVFHAAAFTSPPKVDQDPLRAMEVNIVGTAHVARFCAARGCRLVYVSTDYVFRGDTGNYREEDPVHPVNRYAWSKLGGECAARLYANALIVRTTFGPEPFPYEKAFIDQWTSRETVSAIAAKLARLAESEVTGVLHVGGPRRTVYDYARSCAGGKDIGRLSVHDVAFAVPADTSLDCSRYDRELAAGAVKAP